MNIHCYRSIDTYIMGINDEQSMERDRCSDLIASKHYPFSFYKITKPH